MRIIIDLFLDIYRIKHNIIWKDGHTPFTGVKFVVLGQKVYDHSVYPCHLVL